MQKDVYKRHIENEKNHWCFRKKRNNLFLIKRFIQKKIYFHFRFWIWKLEQILKFSVKLEKLMHMKNTKTKKFLKLKYKKK